MDIYELVENIASRDDFIEFLRVLRDNYSVNRADWDNDDLPSYLEGVYGYCYDNVDNASLTWREIAKIFLSARVYE